VPLGKYQHGAAYKLYIRSWPHICFIPNVLLTRVEGQIFLVKITRVRMKPTIAAVEARPASGTAWPFIEGASARLYHLRGSALQSTPINGVKERSDPCASVTSF
jgi:hypothetical protein